MNITYLISYDKKLTSQYRLVKMKVRQSNLIPFPDMTVSLTEETADVTYFESNKVFVLYPVVSSGNMDKAKVTVR